MKRVLRLLALLSPFLVSLAKADPEVDPDNDPLVKWDHIKVAVFDGEAIIPKEAI